MTRRSTTADWRLCARWDNATWLCTFVGFGQGVLVNAVDRKHVIDNLLFVTSRDSWPQLTGAEGAVLLAALVGPWLVVAAWRAVGPRRAIAGGVLGGIVSLAITYNWLKPHYGGPSLGLHAAVILNLVWAFVVLSVVSDPGLRHGRWSSAIDFRPAIRLLVVSATALAGALLGFYLAIFLFVVTGGLLVGLLRGAPG